MAKLEEIVATYLGERFRFSNADGDTIIGRAWMNGEISDEIAIKGQADVDELQAEQEYRFYGSWTTYKNRRTGEEEKQFAFQSFVLQAPHSRVGVIEYLRHAAEQVRVGFGPARAARLWELYGSEAVKHLREAPEEVAARLSETPRLSLSADAARKIADVLREQAALEGSTITVTEILSGRGFRKDLTRWVIRDFGAEAADKIRANPFLLIKYPGCGFKNCDALWLELGLPAASLTRQAYCVWDATISDANGSTWIPWTAAEFALRSNIGSADVQPEAAIQHAIDAGLISSLRTNGPTGPISDEGNILWLAEANNAATERRLAELVADAMSEPYEWPAIEEIENIDGQQPEILRQALGGPIAILRGRPGTGKAQPLDAKVMTPTGWRLMGDIRPGDMVISPDGLRVKVKAVFPQGVKPVYRVEMSDGSSTECCMDHLWLTKTRAERKRGAPGKVRSLEEILSTIDRGDGSANHSIPMVSEFNIDGPQLPLDPYLLGLLLGDGGFTGGSPVFSKSDQELVEYVRTTVPVQCYLHTLDNVSHAIYGRVRGRNELTQILIGLGLWGKLSSEKHIPDAYKWSSFANRLAILQGLLDTDGHCEKTGHNVEYSTSSEKLANDVIELVRSLGGVVSVRSRVPAYTYGGERKIGKTSWRILVGLPPSLPPFRLSRKSERYKPRTKYPPRRRIEGIQLVGEKPCQCISVDSEDGLYITDDYIVTHNTFTAANVIKALIRKLGQGTVGIGAPTNIAAHRLNMAMAEYNVPVRARSNHSLLGMPMVRGEKWHHNPRQPFPYKVLVFDEESMKDAEIACAIFEARAKGTLVLLIGDTNQLPPVDVGAPLRDLVAAGVPNAELTDIRRNSGGIVEACAAIAEGRPWRPAENLRLIPVEDEQEQLAAILQCLRECRQAGRDPVWDSRVIVPKNETRQAINKVLQGELNPNPPIDGCVFRVNDKVICRENKDHKLVSMELPDEDPYGEFQDYENADTEVRIANGEIGRVTKIGDKFMEVELDHPKRVVRVPLGKPSNEPDEPEGHGPKNRQRKKSTGTGCCWDLAYAVTFHSSQGSEFPWAICVASSRDVRMGSRELVYTGFSRAKEMCVAIGTMPTWNRFCRRVALDQRKTFLKEMILAERAGRELGDL